jgi:hypothetical protein
MHGSASGPLGALLLIAPLAAIPVFAIVGVPQFSPLAASPSDDEEEFADLGDSSATLESRPAESSARGRSADDLFAPFPESSPRSELNDAPRTRIRESKAPSPPRGRSPAPGTALPDADALDHWEIRPGTLEAMPRKGNEETAGTNSLPEPGADRADDLRIPDDADDGSISADDFRSDLLKPNPARPRSNSGAGGIARLSPDQRTDTPRNGGEVPGNSSRIPESMADSMSEQSGWQMATRRLKELGIRKYHLESQIDEQTFTFWCTFASSDNPRITRRFEADADTPLEAVQKVLAQIDEWRARDVRNKVASVGRDD